MELNVFKLFCLSALLWLIYYVRTLVKEKPSTLKNETKNRRKRLKARIWNKNVPRFCGRHIKGQKIQPGHMVVVDNLRCEECKKQRKA